MPTTEQIQPLNYCAHAIEDLKRSEADCRDTMPISAAVFRGVIELLQRSIKFILPNRADLVAVGDLRQAHIDLVRLPYPCVAFESPWEQDAVFIQRDGPFQERLSNKRIALCWEPDPRFELLPGLHSVLRAYPQGGVFVLPIIWTPERSRWHLALGGSFFPYENQLEKRLPADALPNLPAPSREAMEAVRGAGLAADDAPQFRCEPFHVLPEYFEWAVRELGSRDKAFTNIILDSRDEVMTLVKACSVINCANVGAATIEPQAALNKKRLASGKQPFFTYKVLQLTGEGRADVASAAGGAHASPRMHLRRGHLRRLQSKVIWVRPTMVGATADAGFVAKDYAVGTPPAAAGP
jgi:hypothetical protein